MKYIIIAGVVILLILLLLIPIQLYAGYKDGAELYVKIGFFKIPISRGKAAEEAGDAVKEQAEQKQPHGKLSYYYAVLKSIKNDVYDIIKYMRKYGIKIENLNLFLKFGWHDRAEVSIAYGMANAVIYSVMGALHNLLCIKDWKIDIVHEYEEEIFYVEAVCILKTRLVHIMVISVKAVKVLIKIKKERNE